MRVGLHEISCAFFSIHIVTVDSLSTDWQKRKPLTLWTGTEIPEIISVPTAA